jgi:hypothetical protein
MPSGVHWTNEIISPNEDHGLVSGGHKVAEAAARVGLTREQAMKIAAAEPRYATALAGSPRRIAARRTVSK